MTPEPSRAKTIRPEPYAGPIWRVEGRPKLTLGIEISQSGDWAPIEEYGDPRTAETRLRYWRHEFPFRDLFVWRVTEQAHPPKL